MPDIDITAVAGGQSPGDTTTDPLVELLLRAMESTRGIAIETDSESDAIALRMRIYRTRKRLQRQGNRQLDEVTVRLKGKVVELVPSIRYIVKDL